MRPSGAARARRGSRRDRSAAARPSGPARSEPAKRGAARRRRDASGQDATRARRAASDPAYPGACSPWHCSPRRSPLACPPNLANGLETPAGARQLITVEAKIDAHDVRRRSAPGVARPAAGSPPPGRTRRALGRNGLSSNRHEGDGTTPAGTFRIGAHDVRQRRRTLASASRTAACAAATGGTRIRAPRPTTPSSTSPAARSRRSTARARDVAAAGAPIRSSPSSSTTCARSCRAAARGSSCTPRPAGRRSAASASASDELARSCAGCARPTSR